MAQVHSVLVRAAAEPCAVLARRPALPLRPFVAGYGAFHTATAAPRRVLPLNLVTLIVDLDGMAPLVFGPRAVPMVDDGALWRRGLTVGLTPAGARALLGAPTRALTGTTTGLDDLLGRRAAELVERLDAAPNWYTRFAVLDALLTRWLRPDPHPDVPTTRAWSRIQHVSGHLKVGALATELGMSRRRLEVGFQREFGLTPKTVARVARFQRAVGVLAAPSGTFATAAACGYADQPHFNREVRALAGVTPTELRAFLQYTGRLTG